MQDWTKLNPIDLDSLTAIDVGELEQPWEQYDTGTYGTAATSDAAIWTTVDSFRCIDAEAAISCADALGRLPEPLEAVHMRIGAQHSMGHVIPAILRIAAPEIIEECHIATLTYSKINAVDWCALLDDGKIKKLAVVCSHYFAKTSPHIYDPSAALFKSRNVRTAIPRSHCKILLARLTNGRTITATGSANTRSAKTTENVELTGNPAVYEFWRKWFETELQTPVVDGERPAKPSKPKAAYSQKRASLGVWAATTAGEDRTAAIAWKAEPNAATTKLYAAAVVETIRQWSPVLPPNTCVTVPPQGASFPDHYAAADLAKAVAKELGISFNDILKRTDEKRYHHPKQSMAQKPYEVIGKPTGIVIVVDDIITSGTTMKLSLDALRAAGIAAFGFAYAGC